MKQPLPGIAVSLVIAAVLLWPAAFVVADPTLPYALPVATQLSNDVVVLEGLPSPTAEQKRQLRTYRSALDSYRAESVNPAGDMSILKSLNEILASSTGYPPLVATAADEWSDAYRADHDSWHARALTTPRSSWRLRSFNQLGVISNYLSRATNTTTTTAQINQLERVARRLPGASNSVSRAETARVGLSSAYAQIGRLYFYSSYRATTGAYTNDTLDLESHAYGTIHRVFKFHVEGVGTNPGVYLLAEGSNTVSYSATNIVQRKGWVFTGLPGSETNRGMLIIDAVKTNYIVGRFSFTAESPEPVSDRDTNRVVTVTHGEFQFTRE
jgi:hypothetical protein